MLKKIFLLLFLLESMASAAYTFIVENSEMVDSYFNIFNAMAMLFQSNSYMDLLRLVFLFGGFFVFLGGILGGFGKDGQGAISGYVKYTIIGFGFLSIIFSRSDTIWVQAENLPTYCSAGSPTTGVAIDNIPTVLAYGFVTINQIGRQMTEIAENAFTTPSAHGTTSMVDSGGFIGSLKSALTVINTDLNNVAMKENAAGTTTPFNLKAAVKAVYNECIFIPFSSKGEEGRLLIDKFASSKHLINDLDALYAGGVVVDGIDARDYTFTWYGDTWTCGGFYDNVLAPRFDTYMTDSVCATNGAAGAIKIITGIADAPVSTYQETLIQAGLINSLEESSKDLGIGVSGLSYATGKTKAEFMQSSVATGTYMAEMLPYLQMTLRGILYAFFPFVFVVVMLPGGIKVITQYMQTLIWIELWSPTAAVVNMFVVKTAESKMGDKIYSSEGLTAVNSIDMLSVGSTISGTASYLYASVPALTWLILKGSGSMLGNVAGAMGARMAANISTDSINKDVGSLAQTDAVNAERLARGQKALSMSEMMHYQSVNQGIKTGSVLGYESMQSNDLIAATSSRQAKTSTEAMKALGAKANSVIQAEALSSAMQSETTLGKMKEMGWISQNGSQTDEQKRKMEKDINTFAQGGAFKDSKELETTRELVSVLGGGDAQKAIAVASQVQAKSETGRIVSEESHQKMSGNDFYKFMEQRGIKNFATDQQSLDTYANLGWYNKNDGTYNLTKMQGDIQKLSTGETLKTQEGMKMVDALRKIDPNLSDGQIAEKWGAVAGIATTASMNQTEAYQREVTGNSGDSLLENGKAFEAMLHRTADNAQVLDFNENRSISSVKDLESKGFDGKRIGLSDSFNTQTSTLETEILKNAGISPNLLGTAGAVGKGKTALATQEIVDNHGGVLPTMKAEANPETQDREKKIKEAEILKNEYGPSNKDVGEKLAEYDVGEKVKAISKQDSQVEHGSATIVKDAKDGINELKNTYRKLLEKENPNMSRSDLDIKSSELALRDLAKHKIASKELTLDAYGKRMEKILENDTEQKLKAANISKKDFDEYQKMKAGAAGWREKAKKATDPRQKAAFIQAANGIENSKKVKDVEAKLKSNEQKIKAIQSKTQAKIKKANKDYSDMGLMKFNKRGEVTHVADNLEAIEQKDKNAVLKRLGSADGQSITTVGISGSEIKRVASVSGEETTFIDKREFSYIRDNKSENAIGYHLVKNGTISAETSANIYKAGDVLKTTAGLVTQGGVITGVFKSLSKNTPSQIDIIKSAASQVKPQSHYINPPKGFQGDVSKFKLKKNKGD